MFSNADRDWKLWKEQQEIQRAAFKAATEAVWAACGGLNTPRESEENIQRALRRQRELFIGLTHGKEEAQSV